MTSFVRVIFGKLKQTTLNFFLIELVNPYENGGGTESLSHAEGGGG